MYALALPATHCVDIDLGHRVSGSLILLNPIGVGKSSLPFNVVHSDRRIRCYLEPYVMTFPGLDSMCMPLIAGGWYKEARPKFILWRVPCVDGLSQI
jgi:hypothetical protein